MRLPKNVPRYDPILVIASDLCEDRDFDIYSGHVCFTSKLIKSPLISPTTRENDLSQLTGLQSLLLLIQPILSNQPSPYLLIRTGII